MLKTLAVDIGSALLCATAQAESAYDGREPLSVVERS
jgi:hypothetical protein